MSRKPTKRSRSARLISVLAIAGSVGLVVAAAVLAVPDPFRLPVLGAVLACQGTVAVILLAKLFRRLGEVRSLRRHASERPRDRKPKRPSVSKTPKLRLNENQENVIANWEARLRSGFAATSERELRDVIDSKKADPAYRLAAAKLLLDWQQERQSQTQTGSSYEFDVVIVSFFSLPGGTTSANAEEIRAYRRAGLRVGLLHHPVYRWNVARPIDEKITDLIDGDGVVLIGNHDSVKCDLMIVRFPGLAMKLLDDLPQIEASQKVLVVNQTPYAYYGEHGGMELEWDIRTVHANLTDWLDDHTWYTIGPAVRERLDEFHADEIRDIAFGAGHWYESIDVAAWRREGRREPTGPIRIGRHSRDSRLKWPDTPELVAACYPEDDAFEIRVLGGVDAVREILGELPGNWIDYPFNSVSPREFLHELDVMVYFMSSEGAEAFGRAPLEAMAVGLPCIMDRRFEPLFGKAAVYCEPHEVASVVRSLVNDPDAYAAQSAKALEHVAENFSYEAQLRRVGAHGVNVQAAMSGAATPA